MCVRCADALRAGAQYTPAEGTEYCRRKVLLLRENVEKLGEARRAAPKARVLSRALALAALALTRPLAPQARQIIALKNRQMRQVQAAAQSRRV